MATFKTRLSSGLAICVFCLFLVSVRSIAQDAPAKESPQAEIRVFSLSNAASAPLLDVIDSIFGDEKLRVAADERTNTVVVKARPDVLQALEGVLQKLDNQVGRQSARSANPLGRARPQASQSGKVLEIHNDVPGFSIVHTLVPDNVKVKKGDLIVQLDDSKLVAEAEKTRFEIEALKAESLFTAEKHAVVDQAISVDSLEAALKVARLQRELFEAEWKLEVAAAEGEITVADEARKVAHMRHERMQGLFQSGQASSDEAQEAALDATRAKIDYELSVARKNILVDYTRPLRQAELELQLKQAEWSLQRARQEANSQKTGVRAKQSAAQVQLELKKHQLGRLQEQIAKCKVHAPSDGVVRLAAAIRKGAVIRQRQMICALEL